MDDTSYRLLSIEELLFFSFSFAHPKENETKEKGATPKPHLPAKRTYLPYEKCLKAIYLVLQYNKTDIFKGLPIQIPQCGHAGVDSHSLKYGLTSNHAHLRSGHYNLISHSIHSISEYSMVNVFNWQERDAEGEAYMYYSKWI